MKANLSNTQWPEAKNQLLIPVQLWKERQNQTKKCALIKTLSRTE